MPTMASLQVTKSADGLCLSWKRGSDTSSQCVKYRYSSGEDEAEGDFTQLWFVKFAGHLLDLWAVVFMSYNYSWCS